MFDETKISLETNNSVVSRRQILKAGALAAGIVALEVSPLGSALKALIRFGDGIKDMTVSEAEIVFGNWPQSIEIQLDRDVPYAFVEAGDSLADGFRGAFLEDSLGKLVPQSWVYPTVKILNTRREQEMRAMPNDERDDFSTVAGEYQFVPTLAQIGLESEGLLKKLQDPVNQKILEKIPHVVLCMSIGFNDVNDALSKCMDSPFDFPGSLDDVGASYHAKLENILETLKYIRRDRLDTTACMLLGLPDLDQVPAVIEHTYGTPLQGQAKAIAVYMNTIMSNVCNNQNALTTGYVNIYRPDVNLKRSDFSIDGLHPSAVGYDRIGGYAAEICKYSDPDQAA